MTEPKKQSIAVLAAIGAASAGAAILGHFVHDSIAHTKIKDCADHASKHQDYWLHDWHSTFGKCIEVQFASSLQRTKLTDKI